MENLSDNQKKYLDIVQRVNPIMSVSDDELDWAIMFLEVAFSKRNTNQEVVYMNFKHIRDLRAKQRVQKEEQEKELFKQQEELYLSRHTNIKDKIIINSIKNSIRNKYFGDSSSGGRRRTKLKK